MAFTGTSPIDPSLDIVARYTLPQYQVDVAIGGTVRTPTLTLRSDPQLAQVDILSLLLFGKPADRLDDGEKRSLQSQAVQTAAGYVASELRQAVAEWLSVDNLAFDVGESLGESRIGVEKYVSEDMFVSFSRQLGKPGWELSIEYQLAPNWQLETSTTSQGNNAIDLFWQERY